MWNAGMIVTLVLGIFVVTASIALFAIRGAMGRRRAALESEIAASGERVVRAPESAVYRGATGTFSRVKGNGVLALTDKRLLFRPVLGRPIDVGVERIREVRQNVWFAGATVARPVMILALGADGEIGFLVNDIPAWTAALRP